MCGIIGYIGKNDVLPILVDGLKRLEYRGYDSSGIALWQGDNVAAIKAVGKIKELEKKLVSQNLAGNLGIAHTRWATHGSPNEENSHPHCDCSGKIWLVHNGIIENYQKIKNHLEKKGHKFKSETDTEVIVHLIEDLYKGNLMEAVLASLKVIKGAYGIVLFHSDEPDRIIAIKMGSPLVVGLGDGETIIASDASAIIRYTKQVIYLDDGEIAEINGSGVKILSFDNREVEKDIEKIEWDTEKVEKNGFPHFMLKEIFSQPETVVNSLRGRLVAKTGKVKLGGLDSVTDKIREMNRVVIAACGTARHSGLVGEYMFEEYAGVLTEVDYASELRYRKSIINSEIALVAISQSGETADTLAAVYEAKEKGALTLGIVNTVGSTIARATDAGIYNHIGPEISVASTKAFTSQVTILALIAVFFGRQRQMSLATGQRIIRELEALPEKIKEILKLNNKIEDIAKKYCKAKNFAFLGRKYNNPVAFEGALKLKELSYIHAEGFPAGEMKHGSIAMIDKDFPSIFISPQDSVYEKNISNIQEIKSRGGKVIAIATEGDKKIKAMVNEVIYIPKTLEMLTPILSVIPLQLFAYYMAILNGRDVDQPRNLAKSVTVE